MGRGFGRERERVGGCCRVVCVAGFLCVRSASVRSEEERSRRQGRSERMASDAMTTPVETGEEPPKYNKNLRAPIETVVIANPRAAVHSKEWKKIMNGDPVEINPSVGHGMKIMTVDEWSSRWKANEDFRSCLACGSLNTKEHHFIQTWCRGNRKWESEILCLDCYSFSWRSYKDPEFSTPQEYEKERWHKMIKNTQARFTKTGEEVSVDV